MSIDYFPLDVAANKAFCNRVSERQRIVSNIKMLKHTLITAPRRFGKTSLSLQSINDSKVIGHKVDLMLSTDAIGTRNIILKIALKNKSKNNHNDDIVDVEVIDKKDEL